MFPEIKIAEGTIKDCIEAMAQIPEFDDNQYTESEFTKRLNDVDSLILIAIASDKVVGFKVGYKRDEDGSFYSWMGGVVPKFRKQKIAKKLAAAQEKWAEGRGYSAIIFKTRNYLKPMLIFALQNGFNIIDVIPKEKISNHRIILRKELGKRGQA